MVGNNDLFAKAKLSDDRVQFRLRLFEADVRIHVNGSPDQPAYLHFR
jgi:hypothetical protein